MHTHAGTRACTHAHGHTAGIYVSDIIDAVPIDKYFELFKPKGGGDGGFIRISMDFVPAAAPAAEGAHAAADARGLIEHSLTLSKEIREGNVELNGAAAASGSSSKRGGLPWAKLLLAAAAVGVALVGAAAAKGGGGGSCCAKDEGKAATDNKKK